MIFRAEITTFGDVKTMVHGLISQGAKPLGIQIIQIILFGIQAFVIEEFMRRFWDIMKLDMQNKK